MNPWRAQFPFFAQANSSGEARVYLDSAASAQKPEVVLAAMDAFAREHYASVHRGVHRLTEDATAQYERTREVLAEFIGAENATGVIFTKGTTEGLNLAAGTLLEGGLLPRGATILATALEHHSNFLPWARAAERVGGCLKVWPITPEGELQHGWLEENLRGKKVALLALTAASNVLGTLPKLKEIIQMAHVHGALVCIDGAQRVAHQAIDVQDVGADFFAFSAHKLYGPTGIGVLYIRPELAEKLPPWQLGGGMVHRVEESFSQTTFAPPPHRFEAGTPPIVEAVGLRAAVEFVKEVGFEKIRAHEEALMQKLLQKLCSVEGLTLYGAPPERIGVAAFNLKGLHAHDVGSILSSEGVAVRVGHHCAQPLMSALGITACVRASLGIYNTEADVDALVRGLEKAKQKLS